MKSLCLVAALAAIGIAQGASADDTPALKPFSLRVVLPADSVNCDRANSLGDVFAAQTGLSVTSAACQGTHSIVEGSNTYTTVTLVIDYMAAAEPIPARAIYGGSEFLGTPSDYSGFFAKYGDCLSARGAQQAAFTAATGLQVFAAYCDASDVDTSPGYSLVVEAFGTAKAQLYSFTQDPALSDVCPQIMAAAQSSIARSGGTVVLSDDTHVFYYATSPIAVDVRILGEFADALQCQAQVTTADAILTKANATGVSAFCVTSTAGSSSYVTLTAVASGDEGLTEDYGYPSPKYSSFAECMGDLNRLVQNAVSNNQNVLGGICKPGDTDGVFVADLYSDLY